MEDEDEAVKIALAKSVLFTIQEEEDCRIVQTISILFHFIYFYFFNFLIFFYVKKGHLKSLLRKKQLK